MESHNKTPSSDKLLEYFLYAFYFILPFNTPLVNIIIPILILSGLIHYKKIHLSNLDKTQTMFISLSIIFFLLHLIYYNFSDNKAEALGGIERKLSFIAFPIVYVLLQNSLSSDILKNCHHLFLASLFFLCGFLFAYWLYKLYNGLPFDFIGEKISEVIDLHRVYFSFYLFFGLLILFEKKFLSEYFLLKVSVFMVFFIYINLMGSRLFTLLSFLLILFKTYQYLIRKKSLPVTLWWITLTVAGIAIFVYNQPFLKTQYGHLVQNLDKGNVIEMSNGVNNRVLQWKSALEIIKKNWILGVTPGDTIDYLVEAYKNISFQYGVDMRFNAHNQFLHNWISFGLAGLLITFLMWAIFFITAIKQKKQYLIWLSVALFLFLNTECLLDRQAGVIFVMGIMGIELFINKKAQHVRN